MCLLSLSTTGANQLLASRSSVTATYGGRAVSVGVYFVECTAHGSVYVAVSAVAAAVLLTRSGKDALATEDMVMKSRCVAVSKYRYFCTAVQLDTYQQAHGISRALLFPPGSQDAKRLRSPLLTIGIMLVGLSVVRPQTTLGSRMNF